MFNFFKKFIFSLMFLLLPFMAIAQTGENASASGKVRTNMMNKLEAAGGGVYDTSDKTGNSALSIIGSIIAILLSLLGIIFVVLVLKSGFDWMTAEGDASKVKLAKERITRAVIGLVIIVSVYAIWNFVLDSFIVKL